MDDTSTQPTPETEAERLQQARDAQREQAAERTTQDHPDAHLREPRSGPDEAVDHERTPGVPPPTVDDYEELLDKEGAESFPASDPPSGW